MASNRNLTNKSQIPPPSNKENVEEPGDKRRKIGLGKMVIPPTNVANTRSKNTLSAVPIQSNRAGAADSLAGSETGTVCGSAAAGIEFKSGEDVYSLLNEKMTGKNKKDYKGRAEQMMEYIKKLRACVKWFQKLEDEYLLEQERQQQTIQGGKKRFFEMEILMKSKQDDLITELEDVIKKHSSLQKIFKKEEADKLAALESSRREMQAKQSAEKSRDTISELLRKAQQDLVSSDHQIKSLKDINKRMQEYNSTLQQYNGRLQTDATTNSEITSKLQNERNVLREQVTMFRSRSDILQEQLSSAKTLLQEVVKEKEELKSNLECIQLELDQRRDERNSQMVQIQSLTAYLGNYKESMSASCTELESVSNRLVAFEGTCSTQQEQMQLLQRKLDSANAKLQMANSTNMEYEHQQKLVEDLQLYLADAESQIIDGEKLRKELHNTILELKGNIRVFCRVRPLLHDQEHNGSEGNLVSYPTSMEFLGRGIDLMHNGKKHSFTFDKVFDHEASQESFFVEISQLVQSALDGYKVCIFAYGQTGSGKTYTMMGRPEESEMKGLIPRSVDQIFQASQTLLSQGWKYKMQASMLEIYNETIRDLLVTNKSNGLDFGKQYTIKHDQNGNTIVSDLTVVDVCSIQEVSYLLNQAAQSRSVGKTQMNEQSSRSHFVFILRLSGVNESTDQHVQGVLNLIDLAGSERLDKSGATGERLKETQHINKSLLSLSEVVASIAKKEDHIPFRNSKLTYLLQPCLGGESKTMMVVNVSPEASSSGESKCSLQFASKVNSCEIGVARRQTLMRH